MKPSLFISLIIFNTFKCFGQTPDAESIVEGIQSSAYFGNAVSHAGDVNGDGYDDVIVGAYMYDNGQINEGVAYIFHGSEFGINTSPALILECNQASANFGASVSTAGDINNDGFDDVIVGANFFDNGQSNEGRAFVYLGSLTGINPIPNATLECDVVGANFGIAVSNAGDINADGFDDVIVGANLSVKAYVYLGSSDGIDTVETATLSNFQGNSQFGFSVSDAGDVNADGFDDVIIGAYKFDGEGLNSDGGIAYLYHGNALGLITTPATILEEGFYSTYFGYSTSGAGDVNNDGFDDVIVGEYQADFIEFDAGSVFIYLGSASGVNTTYSTRIDNEQYFAHFGKAVSSAGDYNADGYVDIVVAASDFDGGSSNEGKVYIYEGSASGIDAIPDATFESNQESSSFGKSISFAGDVNNDGFSDLLIGASFYDNMDSDEGRIYVFHGNDCPTSTFYPDHDGDGFGSSILSAITCNLPDGHVLDNSDCNDFDSLQHPLTIWYFDADEDFYYNDAIPTLTQCSSPGIGYTFNILGGSDCDDNNNQKYPDAEEQPDYYDNDCDGFVDESLNFQFDGFLSITDDGVVNDVSKAGDINGDGFDDIIIGSPDFDIPNMGIAMVFNGSIDGIQLVPSFVRSDTQSDSDFGSVAGAGDVNNDGYDDIIIGAPLFDNPSYREGKIEIFYGSSTGLPAIPNLKIEGSMSDLGLGNSVSSAGDINNDGYDDIIVGASLYNSGNGRIYVYYGSAVGITNSPLIINGTLSGEHFGYDVCSTGDVNGDGFDDVAVGAPLSNNGQYNEGRVYIYHGSASGLAISPATILESNQAICQLGFAVAGGGDINNDGFDDLIVGAPNYSNGELYEGSVFVYLGSSTGINSVPVLILENNIQDGRFGNSVSGIQDMDNDNFDDIIIGSPNYSGNFHYEGKIFVYHGNSFALDVDNIETIEINQLDAKFGISVSGAGDINGDSYADIVVGAGNYFDGEDMVGGAFVYTSIPCAPSPELCNSLDDNCNGLIDDGITETISISAGGPITFCQGSSVSLTATYSGATVQWKKNGTNIPGATSATYNVTTKGNYSCVTTSACDTTESTPIFVNVIKNPNASISAGGPTTFCAGGSVVLTEVNVAGCTYQWYKGATPIAGATSLTYSATTPGNYKCRVTKAATGCYKNSNAIAVSVPCKEGLPAGEAGEMLIDENACSIYPNPNNGTFTIEANVTTQDFASPETTIEIYNNLGQLIYSEKTNSQDGIVNEIISIGNAVSGIYLLKIKQGDYIAQSKIVIE